MSFIPIVRQRLKVVKDDISTNTRLAFVPAEIECVLSNRASEKTVMQDSNIFKSKHKSVIAEDTDAYCSKCQLEDANHFRTRKFTLIREVYNTNKKLRKC